MEHDETYYNCTCPICGKKFHLRPYSLKKAKTHYCSRECFRLAKMESMKGSGNHQYGLKGSKNASWKSDRKISNFGYVLIRQLDHPFKQDGDWVFEHRIIAEQYLLTDENSVEINGKRYLSPDYTVHHINFDRMDNRLENLVVMTKAEHQKFHNVLNPRPIEEFGRFLSNTEIIKFKKTTMTAIEPTKGSLGAAAFDLYADIEEPVVIEPYSTEVLETHIAFDFPKGYYGQIYARSGLSTKHGIRPATCVSIIDNDYHGSVGVPLHNDSDTPYTVMPGDRVSQIIFDKAVDVELVLVDSFDNVTERETKGYGSTGR